MSNAPTPPLAGPLPPLPESGEREQAEAVAEVVSIWRRVKKHHLVSTRNAIVGWSSHRDPPSRIFCGGSR